MSAPIPNPWMSYSEAENSPASDTAAAIIDTMAAAAVPIDESFMTMEAPDEAPAVIENPEDRRDFDLDGTDHIHEIFFGYAKQPESEFPPGFDPHAFMDKLEEIAAEIEQPPSFLRQA